MRRRSPAWCAEAPSRWLTSTLPSGALHAICCAAAAPSCGAAPSCSRTFRTPPAQYNLPPLKKKVAYKANRDGVVEHFPDPMVRASIAADLELLDHYDTVIGRLELQLERTAKVHDPNTFMLLKTIPGVGRILGMTLLYEICTVERFPRVQEFMSYARLVRPPKSSAGKRTGQSSGKKIGNPHLKWALSEAMTILIRESAPAKDRLARLESKHGPGKARSILTARLGRSVYHMMKKGEAFDIERFLGQG